MPVRAIPGERDVDCALARSQDNGPGAAATSPALTPVLVHPSPRSRPQFLHARPLGIGRDLTKQRVQVTAP